MATLHPYKSTPQLGGMGAPRSKTWYVIRAYPKPVLGMGALNYIQIRLETEAKEKLSVQKYEGKHSHFIIP